MKIFWNMKRCNRQHRSSITLPSQGQPCLLHSNDANVLPFASSSRFSRKSRQLKWQLRLEWALLRHEWPWLLGFGVVEYLHLAARNLVYYAQGQVYHYPDNHNKREHPPTNFPYPPIPGFHSLGCWRSAAGIAGVVDDVFHGHARGSSAAPVACPPCPQRSVCRA